MGAAYRIPMRADARHPWDVRARVDAPGAPLAQNGRVHPLLRRLPRHDLALVAVLGIAVVLFDRFIPDLLRDPGAPWGDAPAPPDGTGVPVPDHPDHGSIGLVLLA